MRIITISKLSYSLTDDTGSIIGKLNYKTSACKEASMQTDTLFNIINDKPGVWSIYRQNETKNISRMKVITGGKIVLDNSDKRYGFGKSSHWHFRFVLTNEEGDELLAIKPVTNWNLQAHDFILQVNEELAAECTSFLILQVLHCAVCSMGMLYDRTVPPIVSTR